MLKNEAHEATEMAQQLKALDASAKDTGTVFRTMAGSSNLPVALIPGYLMKSFVLQGQLHTCGTNIKWQAHTYTQIIRK